MASLHETWDVTDQQIAFVENYLRNGYNGRHAAIKAGYAVDSADSQASRMLDDAKVIAYKDHRAREIADRLSITPERIANEYAKMAFGRLDNVIETVDGRLRIKDTAELDDDARAMLAEASETVSDKGAIKLSIKTHDRKGALDSLCKLLGLNKERDAPEAAPVAVHVYLPDNTTTRQMVKEVKTCDYDQLLE